MSGFYFLVIVTIISAIVSLGFSLNAVADRKQNQKSQTNALYALSRSLVLFLLSIIALFTGSAAFLTGVALAVALTHIFDGFIGIILKNDFKTYGQFITGFLILYIIVLFTCNANFLTCVALAVAFTHIFDGFNGIILKNDFKTYGPFITGFLHLVIIAIFAKYT